MFDSFVWMLILIRDILVYICDECCLNCGKLVVNFDIKSLIMIEIKCEVL